MSEDTWELVKMIASLVAIGTGITVLVSTFLVGMISDLERWRRWEYGRLGKRWRP